MYHHQQSVFFFLSEHLHYVPHSEDKIRMKANEGKTEDTILR